MPSLRIGDTVKVWSKSAGDTWLEATVVQAFDEDDSDKVVNVEYYINDTPHRKCLRTSSRSLKHASHADASLPDSSPARKWSNRISRKEKANDQHRPECLAKADEVTEDMKKVQRESPVEWAITLGQWNEFIDTCEQSALWAEIQRRKGCVNLHDLNEYFVIPWSQGTGCGIAILMAGGEPMEAELMLSHSWSEDTEECQSAVNTHCRDADISPGTLAWFCGFALYQPEDGCGPSIAEQLQLNPFTKVITSDKMKSSSGRMLAVHTSKADLYGSLWCVREIREAMSEDVKITAAMSVEVVEDFKNKYIRKIRQGAGHNDALRGAGVTVDTVNARCRDCDTDMLFKELYKHCNDGSLAEIHVIARKKRVEMLSSVILEVIRDKAMNGKPKALFDLAKEGNLPAVDMLYEVADIGDRQARDAVCGQLQSFARFSRDDRPFNCFTPYIGEPDPHDLKLQLAVALLQIMAQMGHEQSCQRLLKMDMHTLWSHQCPKFLDSGSLEKEETSLWRQCAFPILQTLAKQGNQQVARRAVDELVCLSKTRKDPPRDSPIFHGQLNCADAALVSLALHWNRQALKALSAIVDEEDTGNRFGWARHALDACREELRSWPRRA